MKELLFNKAYEKFTPDWFENLAAVDQYLYENNRTLREFWDQYIEQFFAHSNKKFKVLDLGCGLGGFSLYLAEKGHEVIGIDISELAIQNANYLANIKNLGNRVRFLKVDITNQTKLGHDFDFIFDSHLLHCLTSDAERKAYFDFIKSHMHGETHYLLETMAFQKGLRTPLEYNFDDNYTLWKSNEDGEEYALRKILPSFELEQEVKANLLDINFLYFHAELTFHVFTEEPDYPIQHLPQTLRLAAKLSSNA